MAIKEDGRTYHNSPEAMDRADDAALKRRAETARKARPKIRESRAQTWESRKAKKKSSINLHIFLGGKTGLRPESVADFVRNKIVNRVLAEELQEPSTQHVQNGKALTPTGEKLLAQTPIGTIHSLPSFLEELPQLQLALLVETADSATGADWQAQ
jgi:hypothetical protein